MCCNKASSNLESHCLTRVAAVLVGAQVRLHLHASSGDPNRKTIHRAGRGISVPTTTAACHHVSEVSPERRREEAVDHWVAARVQVAKDKKYVVYILWRMLDHLWLKPVPDPQQIVGGPADDEGANDRYGHLKGLHPCLGYHVCSSASKALLTV